MFYVLITMSISIKPHELWCAHKDMRLNKYSIIIIVLFSYKLQMNTVCTSTLYNFTFVKYAISVFCSKDINVKH